MVSNRLAERAAGRRCCFLETQLFWSADIVDLAFVRRGIVKNSCYDPALIFGRNESRPALLKWKIHITLFDHRRHEEHPLGKEGRAQMGDTDTCPVENPFREPVLKRSVAGGTFTRDLLRHIDDCFETLLPRCLAKGSSSLNETPADRITEVGSLDAFESGLDRREVVEIAEYDLGAKFNQIVRASVLAVREGSYSLPFVKQVLDRRMPGQPGCACYE